MVCPCIVMTAITPFRLQKELKCGILCNTDESRMKSDPGFYQMLIPGMRRESKVYALLAVRNS